ncbi:MAG: DUF2237 domain-containing protein [Planctomycetota bacterium]|nr:DUF2237 domain-containing protein [Planctomycetota bacterium]
MSKPERDPSINVLGGPLAVCGRDPQTGWFRNGCCDTGPDDVGSHTVCVRLTADFLVFSRMAGNDLSTPQPQFGFPGLKAGDRWCLCAARWLEAYEAGMAPDVILEATHVKATEVVPKSLLESRAVDRT